jgi:leucyl aminopeptidase (aminopeptidase T)
VQGFDPQVLDAMPAAQNVVLGIADVQPGEDVLVVMHSGGDFRIAEAIGAAARAAGAYVDVLVHEGPERGARVSRSLLAAMANADVIFTNSLIHHTAAREHGARVVGLYMKDLQGLLGPGARFPAPVTFKICELATAQWKAGKTIQVTCGYGSDLSAEITAEHHAFGHISAPLRPGEFLNFAGGFGGLCLWPDWTANGVVYFDTLTTFEGRNRTPLKWTVENGRVVDVEGEQDRVDFLKAAIAGGGQDADHFGEIMIGLCPTARLQFDSMFGGLYLETERHAGVMHCAVGSSTDLYDEAGNPKTPSVYPSIHLDCMNLRPTIRIDGELSVDDGRLVVLDHPDVQALAAEHGVSLSASVGAGLAA